jgi:isoquinoline 1-oxidoreductase subunit beta
MSGPAVDLTRRQFVTSTIAAAGCLVVGVRVPWAKSLAATVDPLTPFNTWLKIAPDETITIVVPVSEVGQGVDTALPMIVAEELECDWTQVRSELAPADPRYANPDIHVQFTGGSTSIRAFFDPMRLAGATAREMLLQAAAQRWNVPLKQCAAVEGKVLHRPSGRVMSYGQLAQAAAQERPPLNPSFKPQSKWRLIGKPIHRLDTSAKVHGKSVFGIDVVVDDMLIGAVRGCPIFGGTLKHVDKQPALAIKGVHSVVTLENAVIVLADRYWTASKGINSLSPQWEPGLFAELNNDAVSRMLHAGLEQPVTVMREQGDIKRAVAAGKGTVEAVYEVPFLAHAAMEPLSATASVGADFVEIWAPTQIQGPAQQHVAQVLGLKPDQVRIHTTFSGGSFGRRLEDDFIVQAVRAAKTVKRPVKLIWSREEDFTHDFYRPAVVSRLRASLDGNGMPIVWEHRIIAPVFPPGVPDDRANGNDTVEGAVNLPYSLPNQRIEFALKNTGVPVGDWRSVGHSYNAYFVECFIDELAHTTGLDPLAYRLALLRDQPRHRKVLNQAASAADWQEKPAPGRFRGLAMHDGYGSVVAQVTEVSVDDKRLRVHRITCAIDCGIAVNPDTVVAQIEGGIAIGLSEALHGEAIIKDGRMQQDNFDTYPVLTLADMPSVDVHIVESRAPIGGVGESGVPPIAPAVANAVFAATGQPVRRLPIRLG